MMQQGKLKRCPCGAALDMVAVDFEGCIALLEAVQVAVESGNLPRCTFHRALKELRAEIYEDAAADAPP